MKAKNFRIGNWVEFKNHSYFEYTTLTQSSFEGDYIENTFKPIKIDDHWLKSLGFKKENGGIYTHGTIELRKDDQWYIVWNDSSFLTTLINVHSLQNLFFAITGTELEFKP